MDAFALNPEDALRHLPGPAGERFLEYWSRAGASIEFYAPRGQDLQTPHAQDEFYIIARGHGTLMCAGEPYPCAPGDLLFVPRGMDHRFVDFSDDFAAWVIFVPDAVGRGAQEGG